MIKKDVNTFSRIRVFGVGGSGGNVVNHMMKSKFQEAQFIVANTDQQDLHKSKADSKIVLGASVARGLGTGMNPDLGKSAAEESVEDIKDALKGSDIVFIACGMGGGTGTGAAPIIAEIAKSLGILTIAVITKPFSFEGTQRAEIADTGIENISAVADAYLIIENDRLISTSDKNTTMEKAFALSDDVLLKAVKGMSEMILNTGTINIDFADVKTTLQNAGKVLFGEGVGKGSNRAELAAINAIESDLTTSKINGAKRVLFTITGDKDLGMLEIQEIATKITEYIDPDAKVIFGTSKNSSLPKDTIIVTLIASDFPKEGGVAGVKRPTLTPSSINTLSGSGLNVDYLNKESNRDDEDSTFFENDASDFDKKNYDDDQDEDDDESGGWSFKKIIKK